MCVRSGIKCRDKETKAKVKIVCGQDAHRPPVERPHVWVDFIFTIRPVTVPAYILDRCSNKN